MKALLHFNASSRLRFELAAIAEPKIVAVNEDDDAAFAREIGTSEVLLHVLKPVTASVIASAPRLRLIQKIGVGVNTIDCEAAWSAGIAVANMPGINTTAVAEHALALMLAVLRRISALDTAVRTGSGWRQPPESLEALRELRGSVVGLVGYGAVARHLAPILQSLGADVRFWSRSSHPDAAAIPMSLDGLFTACDILSLHVPITPDTRRLIDRRTLGLMKQGAIVVNTARGGLIDQAALIDALRAGHIAGAGLDVFEEEPLPAVQLNALAACPNVVLTPHIAWLTPATISRSLGIIVENCRRLKNGEPLLHQIGVSRNGDNLR